jgi:hypothetical protein
MARSTTAALGAALCASTLFGAAPAAAEDAQVDATRQDSDALGTHQKNIRLDLGGRAQFVKSSGLDPFSTRDVLGQVSLAASYGFWAHDQLSLAGVVGFDYGGSSASARSDRATLNLARFTLAPEVRYHVLRVLAVTAKVGPTLTRQEATLESGVGTDLSTTSWKLGFDATAGVALELFGYRNGASNKPRLWVFGEGGYGWTAPNKLSLQPAESASAPQRLNPLVLNELSISGPLFRIGAALSFW